MALVLNPETEFSEVTEELWQYVFWRDNCICQNCGGAGNEAHHIIYRSLGGKNKANNLILLCWKCHHHEHNIGATRSVEYYQNRVKVNEEKYRKRLV